MEKPLSSGIESKPSPEKDYAYFVDHPEELTVEELDHLGFFFNNFPARIFAKDTKPISQSREELYTAINEAILEIGFDFERYKEKKRAWNDLRSRLNQISQQHKDRVATPEEEDQATELIAQMDTLAQDMSPMILELYKVLRQKGFEHSRLTS